MKKIITVCGNEIPVASNAASMIRYKMAFHRDAMRDLMLLAKGMNKRGSEEQMLDAIAANEDFDLDVFFRFLWIFAKSADDNIPELVDWLAGFDVPALDFAQDALPQIQDLLTANLVTSVKSKKK